MGLVEFLLSSGNIVLLFSIILIVAIFAAKSGAKFGTPTLLLFLFIGMLFGSDGLGIQFNSSNTAQFIGMLALSVILFSALTFGGAGAVLAHSSARDAKSQRAQAMLAEHANAPHSAKPAPSEHV